MIKKIMILFGFLLSGFLQASENDGQSPTTVIRNLSDLTIPSYANKKKSETSNSFMLYSDGSASINEDDSDNDSEFFDLDKHGSDQEQLHAVKGSSLVKFAMQKNETLTSQIPLLSSQDITSTDQYSGYDIYFDQLYQFAKRDLYLAQQNEKMFPDKEHSYENLKKYYLELKKQRQEMAAIKQAMGKNNRIAFDADKLNTSLFDRRAQEQLTNIKHEYSRKYHINVIPSQSKKLLMDYKVPYEPQLELNKLSLLSANIVLQQLQMLQE